RAIGPGCGPRPRGGRVGRCGDRWGERPDGGSAAAMDLMTGLSFWAQAQPGAANPNTIALLALRRWCGGLTLSSPRAVPGWHGLSAFLAGLAVLFLIVLAAQGPARAFRQLLDIPGHIRLFPARLRPLPPPTA